MNLQTIMEEAHRCAKEKGWWDPPKTFPEQIALMHSELSEALEQFRDHGLTRQDFLYYDETRLVHKPEGIAVELADVIIRIADTCAAHRIPLVEAIERKMAYNRTRPRRHGGKRC